MIYGIQRERNQYTPLRSVIEAPSTSDAGNTILRVGHEVEGGTWQASEHVVLTPSEAFLFARTILVQIPLPRVDVGLQTGGRRQTFFGASAISEAEQYIGAHLAEGEWYLDVSDDRCTNCLQTFSAEARVETSAGWACPFCAGDPREGAR